MNLRKKIQALGVSVSMNDFVIKCTANALARCPQINVVWAGEQVKTIIIIMFEHLTK